MKDLFPKFMFEADKGGQDGSSDTETKDTNLGGQGESGADKGTGKGTEKVETLTKEEIEKMIQSATDKVRTDYSKKLKEKEQELEETKKAKMTEEEKAKYELDQLKENLSQKEKDLLTKELTIETIDLLKEHELPLEAKDFLMASDKENTVNNIKAFKEMFNNAVTQAVETRFKATGKDIKTGDNTPVVYTEEMLKTMSPTEINANWSQISKDLAKQ